MVAESKPAPSRRRASSTEPSSQPGTPVGTPRLNSSRDRAASGSPLRRSSSSASTVSKNLFELAQPLLDPETSQEKKAIALTAFSRALRAGASPKSWQGPDTPLQGAVTARSAEMVRLLLEAKADPKESNEKGVSVLHNASFEGLADICEMLLQAKADANAADQHGQTALFFAPSGLICEKLIAFKADVNSVNQKSQSALHLAARAGLTEVLVWLSGKVSREIVEMRDHHGATAAYYARHAGISSEFLAKHKLSIADPAASRRRTSAPNLGTSEKNEDAPLSRVRARSIISGLARAPLPPLLEDQQGSDSEGSDADGLEKVSLPSRMVEKAEDSEEELLSSSTTVTPSAGLQRSDEEPPAEEANGEEHKAEQARQQDEFHEAQHQSQERQHQSQERQQQSQERQHQSQEMQHQSQLKGLQHQPQQEGKSIEQQEVSAKTERGPEELICEIENQPPQLQHSDAEQRQHDQLQPLAGFNSTQQQQDNKQPENAANEASEETSTEQLAEETDPQANVEMQSRSEPSEQRQGEQRAMLHQEEFFYREGAETLEVPKLDLGSLQSGGQDASDGEDSASSVGSEAESPTRAQVATVMEAMHPAILELNQEVEGQASPESPTVRNARPQRRSSVQAYTVQRAAKETEDG